MDVEITTPDCQSIQEKKSTKMGERGTMSLADRSVTGSYRSKATIVFHFEYTLASVVESLPATLKKSHFDHIFKVKVKSTNKYVTTPENKTIYVKLRTNTIKFLSELYSSNLFILVLFTELNGQMGKHIIEKVF
jgi:hypothetical protein